jgi:hypothetical protein
MNTDAIPTHEPRPDDRLVKASFGWEQVVRGKGVRVASILVDAIRRLHSRPWLPVKTGRPSQPLVVGIPVLGSALTARPTTNKGSGSVLPNRSLYFLLLRFVHRFLAEAWVDNSS